jgi:hypothetical protein
MCLGEAFAQIRNVQNRVFRRTDGGMTRKTREICDTPSVRTDAAGAVSSASGINAGVGKTSLPAGAGARGAVGCSDCFGVALQWQWPGAQQESVRTAPVLQDAGLSPRDVIEVPSNWETSSRARRMTARIRMGDLFVIIDQSFGTANYSRFCFLRGL